MFRQTDKIAQKSIAARAAADIENSASVPCEQFWQYLGLTPFTCTTLEKLWSARHRFDTFCFKLFVGYVTPAVRNYEYIVYNSPHFLQNGPNVPGYIIYS